MASLVLLFLLPTTGKIEGVAAGYWQGVKLRLSSGHYWAIALLGGMGAGIVLAALIVLSSNILKTGK